MKIAIVINTYIVTTPGEKNPFDHPTPLWSFEQENTLKATLESLKEAAKRTRDEVTLYLFGIAANEKTDFDEEIEAKMRTLVSEVGELPLARVITNRQVKDLKKATGIDFFESAGYPEIRNLGLLIPNLFGEELIMQLDDDELVRPEHVVRFAEIFEEHPEYGIVTAPYEKNGTVRIKGKDPLSNWRKYSAMDQDLEALMETRKCSKTLFGFGGNLCLRTSVARDAHYPRRVPRGEDFSFLLANRLLFANGDPEIGFAPGQSKFLTWFCPEEKVTILHRPPVEAKAAFLRYFENNLNRFILERRMITSQTAFTFQELAENSHYLTAMFGQKDFKASLTEWIEAIRGERADISDMTMVDQMEERLLAAMDAVEATPRWNNYLVERRAFQEAQERLSHWDLAELLPKIRGWME